MSNLEFIAVNPDKPVTLPGAKCAYCGCELSRRTSTNDHVIGRRFVPEGALIRSFHLQVKACRPCNDKKARLEDDISIITMLPDTAGKYARDDDRLRRTVARKSKGAISPATRKLVAESYNKMQTKIALAPTISLNVDFIAMPTMDDHRVGMLAYYHVQGFCFFKSFDPAKKHGRWLEPQLFHMLGQLIDADWGNPQFRHFSTATGEWDRVCVATLADGYFQHAMLKEPNSELFAWVLEWNNRLRVFGLYGPAEERAKFISEIPPLQADYSEGDTTNGFALRYDTALSEDDDTIFDLPDSFENLEYSSPHWR